MIKILNPAYVEVVTVKQTNIRAVIAALVAAMPTSDKAINFARVTAAVEAQYPALNFARGDLHAAALALGLVVVED